MKKKIFIAAAVCISTTAWAQQADSLQKLKDVVVTATKYAIKTSSTGKVITIIDQAELARHAGRQLGEVLALQTGVVVSGSNNTPGTNQDIYVRGAAAGKTLLLIDGVPVYDPSGISGAFDINFIPLENIERIEILKGSQSTLYGSDAIAGVINIITKKGAAKKLQVNALLAAGSYDTYKGTLSLNGTMKNTNYNVYFGKYYSKGISSAKDSSENNNYEKDGFKENTAGVFIQQKISSNISLQANGKYSQYNADLDADRFTDDPDNTVKTKNIIGGLGAVGKWNKSEWHLNYNYNESQRHYLDDSLPAGSFTIFSKSNYTGKSHFAELYNNYAVNTHLNILAGLEYRRQSTTQDYLSVSSYGPFETALGDSAKVYQEAVYASLLWKDLGGINLEVGVRYNHFTQFGNVITWSVNPSYVHNNKWKFFANLASGFKAPTLYQLYSEYRNINDDLKAEKSLSADAGIEYKNENTRVQAAYFIRNVKDNIVFYSSGAPDYLFYYINADKQKDKGLELEASYKTSKFLLAVNYTNLDGKVVTKTGTKDTAIFNLYRRPQQVINLMADFNATNNLLLSMSVRTQGERKEPIYGQPQVTLPSYTLWNLRASYNIKNYITLFTDLKNILNEKYSEFYGYNSLGINVLAGLTLKL